jgi:membrane protease YdiL (CAAX protease family)
MGMKKTWINITAKVIGSIAAAYWFVAVFGNLISGDETGISLEGIILTVLVCIAIAGVLVAWMREKTGGVIVSIAALALCIFAYVTAGRNKGFAVLVSGAPFLLSGILFLLNSYRIYSYKTGKN